VLFVVATAGAAMGGTDEAAGSLFGRVGLAGRIPARRPLRAIGCVADDALAGLDAAFDAALLQSLVIGHDYPHP
jgi:hypothetical protein